MVAVVVPGISEMMMMAAIFLSPSSQQPFEIHEQPPIYRLQPGWMDSRLTCSRLKG